jgi:hypothetical protein
MAAGSHGLVVVLAVVVSCRLLRRLSARGSGVGEAIGQAQASRANVVPCIKFQTDRRGGKGWWVWLIGGWC